jgi:hypothetical protein
MATRTKAAKKIEVTLVADRVTKGAVRFVEDTEEWPLNIYLRKEQVEALGVKVEEGEAISISIEAA